MIVAWQLLCCCTSCLCSTYCALPARAGHGFGLLGDDGDVQQLPACSRLASVVLMHLLPIAVRSPTPLFVYAGHGMGCQMDAFLKQLSQCKLKYKAECGPAVLCCADDPCVLQEMQRKGITVLVPWSPTTLIRYWDLRWAQYQQRLMSSRARRKELQMHRRMLALGLPAQSS